MIIKSKEEQTPEWQPLTVEMTFETRDEFVALVRLLAVSTRQQIDLIEKFEMQYRSATRTPLPNDVHDILWSIWNLFDDVAYEKGIDIYHD
jgi:hypothetical protein